MQRLLSVDNGLPLLPFINRSIFSTWMAVCTFPDVGNQSLTEFIIYLFCAASSFKEHAPIVDPH